MPYNLVAGSFYRNKLCSRLSWSEVRFYTENGRFAFLGGIGQLQWSLRLIGKRIAHSGLPISVDWTFFARHYGWGATSEYLFKIGDFAPTGAGWPTISNRSHPTDHCSRLNDLSYGIKIWTDLSSVLSQCAIWQRDRRTERILIDRPHLHSMQRGNNNTCAHISILPSGRNFRDGGMLWQYQCFPCMWHTVKYCCLQYW